MGGGPVPWMHKQWSGVELCVEQMLISLGHYSPPPITNPDFKKTHSVYVFANSLKTGQIRSDVNTMTMINRLVEKYLTKYEKYNTKYVLKDLVRAGDFVTGPTDGLPTFVAELGFSFQFTTDVQTGSLKCTEIVQEIYDDVVQAFAEITV